MKLFTDVYMKTVWYVSETEDAGVQWSVERTLELTEAYQKLADAAEDKVRKVFGQDINLGSTKQLRERMFDDLGYSTAGLSRTEKTQQWQLNEAGLAILAEKYPACAELVNYRKATKMINTYLTPNAERVEESVDGRIHQTIWITTATGRKRASNPNLQNQPVIDGGLSIRSCIVPAPGRKLIVADLSQMQLRMIAHISKDPAMTKAYTTWQCLICEKSGEATVLLTHCPCCGVEADDTTIDPDRGDFKGFWHGLDLHGNSAKATKLDRRKGKTLNFAVVFGASAWKLNMEFGGGEAFWDRAIKAWFKEYSGIKRWHLKTEKKVKKDGFVRDPMGRRRRFPPAYRRKYSPKHVQNQAVNAPIQAIEAQYLDLAILNLRKDLIEVGVWENGVWLTNVVHDEIVLEAEDMYVEDTEALALHHLRYAVPLRVPVNADACVVDSWHKAK
jgi:DNA polymerase-1